MAKKSVVARNEKRKRLVEKYAAKREELLKAGDYEALRKLPRDSSASRVRNRCVLTGRGRGVYEKFGLCRHMFRKLALEGKLPGVKKASW
ncbi:30S ribosomal protein S14 [Chlorobium phaeovibrioides]|uniref:Small ribosomal subunit protein uS14 n=2 Tax=Chlorobium phaeovibrioides TaxID=1094 RepID=RS14_CHLPM|nr:30S ribosomal protein S14 [Chlorobium phaeovibrioides]A4SCS2.1 RecName: Full=Small ribosomal subunit protein uS14; AltName: Full=30S ribosomal protein S14 [Chlorobium phaeovibrioides DSM 265]NQU46352.1 30S ribosomal protein S14 [Chlorobium sp.]KAA6231907.1 30S ribosomal protein S14 [Chlorobium phaeovibrioides]MDT9545840.1 30S ribosomal protein S14 [Chlorobium phaeovibrioides]MWV53527.1 30S ribosomal protein S14 [Chlorobium phaeovibrioides]QEQ57541.1 30S ribosomal protein S14 [Chlorobium ph